jgi:hypothetical protein
MDERKVVTYSYPYNLDGGRTLSRDELLSILQTWCESNPGSETYVSENAKDLIVLKARLADLLQNPPSVTVG